ncbi:MAG: hypothetical protein OEZ43_21680 [Gammaproteobacteria bacterium]|nr:hypothetical protein [Gammaproteobacteria bacterium]
MKKWIFFLLIILSICQVRAALAIESLSYDRALKCVMDNLYYDIYWKGSIWMGVPQDRPVRVILRRSLTDVVVIFDVKSKPVPLPNIMTLSIPYYVVDNNFGDCGRVKYDTLIIPLNENTGKEITDPNEIRKQGYKTRQMLYARYPEDEKIIEVVVDSKWEPKLQPMNERKRKLLKLVEYTIPRKSRIRDFEHNFVEFFVHDFNLDWSETMGIAIYYLVKNGEKKEVGRRIAYLIQLKPKKPGYLLDDPTLDAGYYDWEFAENPAKELGIMFTKNYFVDELKNGYAEKILKHGIRLEVKINNSKKETVN